MANDATTKARDMEKAGYMKSYYPDVEAERLKQLQQKKSEDKSAVGTTLSQGDLSNDKDATTKLPTPNDNPLDECRTLIAYYKRCCDRELKKKKNWILTEPYRVQEEYRYKKNG